MKKLSSISVIFVINVLIVIVSPVSIIQRSSVKPVILVPGDGGSQVEAKLNKTKAVHYLCEKTTNYYFNIWLNMELLVPIIISCWIDNMKLVYDNKTRTTSNSPGVYIRIPGFGSSGTVEWLDPSEASVGAYFKSVANLLLDFGYERNVSIRGAPYDFRKAPNENTDYFVKLKHLVEETYRINDFQPVILLAHSMGGPMSLHFLHQQSSSWKNKYIRALVTLSAVWGGSVKALKVFAVGDDLGSRALSQSRMREQQITSPSLAWLMPSSFLWHENEVLVQTDKTNYTRLDFQQFFEDIEYPTGWEMRKDVEKYTYNFEPPGVEVHCLHGYGVETIERLVYEPGNFPGYPTFIYGDGDGTVNKRSLEACLLWQGKQDAEVYHRTFANLDHMAILQDERILDYIENLIRKL